MKRVVIAATTASAIVLAACTPTQFGTATGAGAGFLLAAALGGNPQQIALGTLVGGAAGFVVGSYVQTQTPGVCQAYSTTGQPLFVTQQGQVVTYNTGYPLLVQC